MGRSYHVFGDIEGQLDVLTPKRRSLRAAVGVRHELQEKGPTMRRGVERQVFLQRWVLVVQHRAQLHNSLRSIRGQVSLAYLESAT